VRLPATSVSASYALTSAALTAAVLLAACGDQGPSLQFTFEKTATDTVASLGTDSVSGWLVTSSSIHLFGVMYAIVSCDEVQVDGDRVAATLTFAVSARTSQQCPPVQVRLAYTLSVLELARGPYQVVITHLEPNTPARGSRTVFSSTLDVQ
jgi:hypothetical protein